MPVKTLLAALFLGAGLLSASASDLDWKTDMSKALTEAKNQKKAVLINFTGSDWCGFCIRLEKEVFSTQEFNDYAKKNLVLVKADFPRSTPISKEQQKANEDLRNQYAKDFGGFPTVVLVHSDGKKAGEIVGYPPGSGPAKYISQVKGKLGG